MMFNIFIGWDSRHADSAEVCRYSILKHATIPVQIHFLQKKTLEAQKFYLRDPDPGDTTEFTYTRFLVPQLCNYSGWALYVDGDFLFQHDVRELFQYIDDTKAAILVKHDHQPTSTVKQDGREQTVYPKKNWSSLVLWNCSHPKNRVLDTQALKEKSNMWLQRFMWLVDDDIGPLPVEWNWLVGWNREPANGSPKALHYTEGGPWFQSCENTEYGLQWYKMFQEWQRASNPPQPGPFDAVPEPVRDVFVDIMRYRVDPQGIYYNKDIKEIFKKVEQWNKPVMYAVEADTMEEASDKLEGKGKAYDPFLESFIMGSGGQITVWDKVPDNKTPVVLRGVTKRKQMKACTEAGRPWYYIDTGYFGNLRKKTYHRITKNSMQYLGPVLERPRDRLSATNYRARKFRPGSSILLAPPSQKLLACYDIDLNDWITKTVDMIKLYTDRPIVIREKASRAARVSTDTIEMALERDVHCLVTFSSIAATEAVLLGKPAIVLGPNAAAPMCSQDLREIENPFVPTLDEVEAWAANLAYCQFTEAEMRNGTAWAILGETDSLLKARTDA